MQICTYTGEDPISAAVKISGGVRRQWLLHANVSERFVGKVAFKQLINIECKIQVYLSHFHEFSQLYCSGDFIYCIYILQTDIPAFSSREMLSHQMSLC